MSAEESPAAPETVGDVESRPVLYAVENATTSESPRRTRADWIVASVLVMSFLASSFFMLAASRTPAATLGGYTDHFSHYSSAILFFHRGFEVYRRSAQELCALTSPEDWAYAQRADVGINPQEACSLPERRGQRPLLINWHYLIRPYPPGVYLFALPSALLYAYTDVAFQQVNQVWILQCVLAAHLMLYALWRLFARAGAVDAAPWAILPVVALETVHWAMAGFYDPVAILFVLLAVGSWSRGRRPAALLWYAVALCLHYRALWYAPLVPLVAWEMVRAGELRRLGRNGRATVVAAVALCLVGAGTFLYALSRLSEFPKDNPLHYSRLWVDQPGLLTLGLALAAVTVALAWLREWRLLGMLLWVVGMLVGTRQSQTWHALFVVPVLALPLLAKQRRWASHVVLGTFLVLTAGAHGDWPAVATFVERLLDPKL